jgi:DNA-binding MarR family transcriptional regulator
MRSGWIGQGKLTAGDLAWWFRLSKSTVHRNLKIAEGFGLVEHEVRTYKNTVVFSWFLTDKGEEFLASQKVLI